MSRAISRLHQLREPLQFRADRCGCRCAPCAPARAPAAARWSAYSFAQAARVHRRRQVLPDFQRDIGVLLGRGAQLQIQPPARLLFERAARRDRRPAGTRTASRRARTRAPRMPMRSSASSADFTSQAIFGRAGVFQPRLADAPDARAVTARASPGCQAKPDGIERQLAFAGFRNRHRHRRARAESPPATPSAPPASRARR